MKQEKVILSFIMVLIGLLVAGTAFYFYQSGNKPRATTVAISPTPLNMQKESIELTLDTPEDELVVKDKNLIVSGQTNKTAQIVVITKSDQIAVKPDNNGNFKTSLILDDDQNIITVIAILPNGENKQIQKVVTYSTASF